MSDVVLGRLEDGVAVVTMNAPQSANVMSEVLEEALFETVSRLAADRGTRCWLIRSEGRNFCAGGDLKGIIGAEDPPAMIGKMARRLHDTLLVLANHRAPVVMAVQGAAAGAGFSMVAGADIAIAARSSSYLWAYAAIGLTSDGGTTWHLPRVIGMRRAQELAYTGRRIGAEEAAAIGLVTRVVEDDALQEEAMATARAIAAGPTNAYGVVKRLFAEGTRNDYATHMEAEAAAIQAALASPDAQNAIKAFFERRTPVFSGE